MGEQTAIAWADHTFNPWQGCTEVSPACDHCYARTLSIRVGHPERWDGERAVTSDGYWRNPLRWDRQAAEAGRPALVFCGSMCDIFEDRDDLDPIRARLWDLVEATPHLRWLLLTKRPEQVLYRVPRHWRWSSKLNTETPAAWPENAWIGTTVEDQQRADERIPRLLEVPAPVRFISCEPLLEDLDVVRYLHDGSNSPCWEGPPQPYVNWVIVGGESGRGHRPLDLEHARYIRDCCLAADVPFFFKQVGGPTPKAGGERLDGELLQAFPPEAGRDLDEYPKETSGV